MNHTLRPLTCVIAMFLLAAAGCGAAVSTSTPTTTAAARTTDTFTGTVAVGARDVHAFTVTAAGTVDVALTAVTPASMVMGISIGTTVDGSCIALSGASAQASPGSAALLSGIVSAGTLCVDVHDLGTLSAPVGYTVTVTHP